MQQRVSLHWPSPSRFASAPRSLPCRYAEGKAVLKGLLRSGRLGLFGSSQSTLLVLKALLLYYRQRPPTKARIGLSVTVDDAVVIGDLDLGRNFDLGAHLRPGTRHTVCVRQHGTEAGAAGFVPFFVDVRCTASDPSAVATPSAQARALALSCELGTGQGGPGGPGAGAGEGGAVVNEGAPEVLEGDVVTCRFVVRNESAAQPLGMVCVQAGVPAGLEPCIDTLDALVARGAVLHYELDGTRQINLYIAGLEPAEALDLRFDATAKFPGRYSSDASRAFTFYSEGEAWAAPTCLCIRSSLTGDTAEGSAVH